MNGTRSPPGVTFTPLPEVVEIAGTPPEVACYYDVYCPPEVYVSVLQQH